MIRVSARPKISFSQRQRCAVLALAMTLLSGCAAPSATTPRSGIGDARYPASPSSGPVSVEHGNVTSFDGTNIYYSLFLPPGASPQRPVPVVVSVPGWGSLHNRTPTGVTTSGLLAADYAVLGYDPRGFGDSGGESQFNSPEFEIRDVSALLDMLAQDPRIAQDAPGDPVVGWYGWSYGAAAGLLAAEQDGRIDALAVRQTYSNITRALLPNGVPKTAWLSALFAYGLAGSTYESNGTTRSRIAPENAALVAETIATGEAPPALVAILNAASVDAGYARLRAPTLLLGGFPDTAFPADQPNATFAALKRQGVPVKMYLYCGGHSGCPHPAAAPAEARIPDMALNWFARHLRDDPSIDTGPPVEFVRSDGRAATAETWPPPGARVSEATGAGPVVVGPGPQAGSAGLTCDRAAPDGPCVFGTPAIAGTLRTPIPGAGAGDVILGDPQARLRVPGKEDGPFLFVRLIDEQGFPIDGHSTALRLNGSEEYDLALPGLAHVLGSGVTIEVAGGDAAHAQYHGAGVVNVEVQAWIPLAGPDATADPAPPDLPLLEGEKP